MWLNIIGYIGGILLAVCAIPEVIRTYNDKRCHLGWPFLLLWFVGEIFMEIYAIALMDYPLIFNYSFNLITTAFLLYYKFKTKWCSIIKPLSYVEWHKNRDKMAHQHDQIEQAISQWDNANKITPGIANKTVGELTTQIMEILKHNK